MDLIKANESEIKGELEIEIDSVELDSKELLSSPNPAISFSHYYFRYGNSGPFALNDIDLHIQNGEIILLGGESGSGKSTLCNTIAGRIPYSITGQLKGTITLLGKDIWDYTLEDLAKNVGYVFQNAEEQLVTFTVFDEIAFAAENFCLPAAEIQDRVTQIAKDLGIEDLLKRSILSLSGGEKQKVILAANMVMTPKILILDEPLAFLDDEGTQLLIKLITQLKTRNPNLTIIIVEHRLNPFLTLLNRIILLNNTGMIEFDGSLTEYEHFKHESREIFLRDSITLQKSKEISQKKKNSHSNNSKLSEQPILSCDTISFAYNNSQQNIFHNFSINIYPGEFLGIVGNNGTGKTTLLYLLAHMLKPIEGQITFFGHSLEDLNIEEYIPKIGFIFQNPENQIFENSIRKEILFAPVNFSKYFIPEEKRSENFTRIDEDINENGIKNNIVEYFLPLIGERRELPENVQNQNPFCLSWGQKRRLNLASIFSYDPDILLVDEPFIGQDASSISRIFEILHQFHRRGKTIIIVSHDRELLKVNCTKIIELNPNFNKNNGDLKPSVLKNKDSSLSVIPTQPKPKLTQKAKKSKSRRKFSRINIFLTQSSEMNESKVLFCLNPTLKLLILVLMTFFLFYQKNILVLMLFYIIILLIAQFADVSVKKLLRQIRWLIVLTMIYIPLNTLFDATQNPADEILFYIFDPRFPVRKLALYYSLRTGLLIIIFVSTAVIYTKTTSPKNLVYSLIDIHLPYRYAFSFMIGLRYIPLIEKESNTIEIAQILRGSGIHKGSSVKKIYHHILQRITTLLISIIRKAKTTSNTIEARGFGLFKERTNSYQIKITKSDIGYLLLSILFLTLTTILFELYYPEKYIPLFIG